MAYTQPTRFPRGGVTNVAKFTPFGDIGEPDPSLYFNYVEDFSYYVAASWTKTSTGAGTAALAAPTVVGENGILLLTNSAGGTDLNSIQLATSVNFMDSSKRQAFRAKISRNNVDETFGVGLQPTNATPFTLVSGLWFQSVGTSTDVTFKVAKASAVTTSTLTAAYPTSGLTTYLDVGFFYDGVSLVTYYLNGIAQGSSVITNLPSSIALMPTISQLNTTANARTMQCDYFHWIVER